MVAPMLRGLVELGTGVVDLVLPTACAGCAAERVTLRYGVCARCVAALEGLRPYATAPEPPPLGLPPVVAVGPYATVLRGTLLAYKEKGRHRLAAPLGALLAGAVAQAAVAGGGRRGGPLLVVPVPSTAAAVRQRHGDHMARLAAHAVRRLRAIGWHAVVVQPLRASPRVDSASLDSAGRASAAENSLRIRPRRIRSLSRSVRIGGTLVVVDDIVTTGATLAAVSRRLDEVNLPVAGAAVLAATRLRRTRPGGSLDLPAGMADWANRDESVSPNEG
jgi:predicted amidophosphoribosyltransferase